MKQRDIINLIDDAFFSDRHRAVGRQLPLIQIKPASAVGWLY